MSDDISLKLIRKHAVTTAKELMYSEDVVRAIKEAETENDICMILREARKKGMIKHG